MDKEQAPDDSMCDLSRRAKSEQSRGIVTNRSALQFCIGLVLLAGCEPPTGGVTYTGGDGSSIGQAVVVQATNEQQGTTAEYVWLQDHFPGFHRENQYVHGENGHTYDEFAIVTADGRKHSVYFDASLFFGK